MILMNMILIHIILHIHHYHVTCVPALSTQQNKRGKALRELYPKFCKRKKMFLRNWSSLVRVLYQCHVLGLLLYCSYDIIIQGGWVKGT